MLVQVAEFVMKAEIEGSNKFRLRELPGDEPYLWGSALNNTRNIYIQHRRTPRLLSQNRQKDGPQKLPNEFDN